MKKIILLSFIILLTNVVFAQKENWNWTFSDSILLRFNENGPTEISTANIVSENAYTIMGGLEVNAALSTKEGSLLFYFDATGDCNDDGFVEESEYNKNCGKIFNRFNEKITNGYGISTVSTFTNGALFLPVPGNTEHFYLFTLGWGFEMGCNPDPYYAPDRMFYYTLIDTSYGYINARVIQKNMPLSACKTLSEKLAAVRHSNGKDWWLMLFNYKTLGFITFLVTNTGIKGPYEQTIPNFFTLCSGCTDLFYGRAGEMCFSPSGEKLAMSGWYSYYQPGVPGSYKNFNFTDLLNFDRCTGKLFNHLRLETQASDFPHPLSYGCAFSPKENYLYVTDNYSLYRFFLTSDSVKKDTVTAQQQQRFCQLELGPDNKIYLTRRSFFPDSANTLSVIHEPDKEACNFILHSLFLGSGRRTSAGLPHFPNFGLGALVAPGVAAAGPDRAACTGPVAIGTPALPGMVYRWRPAAGLSDTTAATPLAAPGVSTTYTLTVWDSAGGLCGAVSDTVRVRVNDLLISPDFTYIIDGFSVSFTSNIADTINYTAKWNFGDGDTSLFANPTHIYPDTGYYFVTLTVTDTFGCAKTITKNIHLTIPNDIPDVKTDIRQIKLYSNPAQDAFTVLIPFKGEIQMTAFTTTGQKVSETSLLGESFHTLDTSGWAAGVYTIHFSEDGYHKNVKLVIVK